MRALGAQVGGIRGGALEHGRLGVGVRVRVRVRVSIRVRVRVRREGLGR